jgi:MFS superfamily sulfate permease-like transporter
MLSLSVGVLLIRIYMMSVFVYLPLSFVAAMMLRTTVGMLDWSYLASLWREDKAGLGVVLLIAFTAVSVDPSAGVVLGVAIEQLLRNPSDASLW